jgi:hypothetical protein
MTAGVLKLQIGEDHDIYNLMAPTTFMINLEIQVNQ